MSVQAVPHIPDAHWMLARVIDPVGKFLSDLQYIGFRRFLVLTMSDKSEFCVHDKCADKFSGVNFYHIRGSRHPSVPVRDRQDAQSHGASGFICVCDKATDDSKVSAKARFTHLG